MATDSNPPAPPNPTEPPGPGAPAPEPPLPDPDVQPSSPPGGPQIIPAPATPPGEPGPDPAPATEVRRSNPNAGSPAGLAGDLGLSSERVPRDPGSIEGTGSRGSATEATDGTWQGRPPGPADGYSRL